MENAENYSNKSTENSNANNKHKSNNENNECSADNSNESSINVNPEARQTAVTITTLERSCSDVPLCNKQNDVKIKHTRKKPMFLHPPNDEMICDDIAATTEDIKRLKHVQVRSNSTGKLYQSSRRVSFPEHDSELVTGCLEPADPWACVKPATCVSELAEFYRDSCKRHNTKPIDSIMKHLDTLDLNSSSRRPVLNLREQNLTADSCEALEELLKRVQYKLIDLTDCGLNDASATALFDMIEYYEAANEIDISENRNITNRGWQACINMVKRSHALQILVTRGTPLSESNAVSLGKSMLTSSLNTLKLEHCGLSGRPIASLCTYLRKNTVLKELWLAHNDLTAEDAYSIGNVLRSNFFLQFLDLSNNNIQDRGVLHVCEALIEQSNYFKVVNGATVTAPQQLSSKHTLTRGDKIDLIVKSDKETKYECLARLINSAQVQCDTINVNASSSDKSADISTLTEQPPTIITTAAAEAAVEAAPGNIATAATATPATTTTTTAAAAATVAVATNKTNESSVSDGNEQQNATVVTTYANSDNNNQSDANEAQSTASDEQRTKDMCELKIVERNERGQQTTSGNMEPHTDNTNTEPAANTTDQIGIDLDVGTNLDNNNSHTTNDRIAAMKLQTVGLVAQPLSQQPTIEVGQDLIGGSDDNTPIQQHTTNNCQLDINENKSDMKLNYAEVVKMDSPMETQLCENRNYTISDDACGGNERNTTFQSCSTNASDLEPKVQMTANVNKCADVIVDGRPIECITKPQPIQKPSSISCGSSGIVGGGRIGSSSGEPDEEMSPICKVRLPLNSPRFTKSKDITNEFPLTPDSSHSLDSSCDLSAPFEPVKPYNTTIAPERSFSSESLNSETSVESNDSKSSIKLAEAKFSKNGTLERQCNSDASALPAVTTPNGLQVLMLWNNNITRKSAQSVADVLSATTTLEVLNVGKNILSNDFIANIKASLKANTSLTSLGLQSVHLTNEGVKTLSEILDFGGNITMQRVDLRDNNLQVTGLTSLNEILKSNKSIIRIDLDDTPRRNHEPSSDSNIDYNRVVNNIRSLCARNENPPEPEPVRTSVKRVRTNFLSSRKISLTCQSIRNSTLDAPQIKSDRHLLDPTRKSSRLRSPSPSPIPSPVSSPIPSPSRSRFQVSRVVESSSKASASSNSCSPTSSSLSSSRFRVTVVEPPKVMCAPVTIINNSTNANNNNNNNNINNNNNNNTNHNHNNNLNYNRTPRDGLEKSLARRAVEPVQAHHIQRTHSAPSSTMCAMSAKDEAVFPPSLPSSHNTKYVKPTDQPIATTLTVIDSPDLESCSSFSSLDSIDRGQSFSSVESFDLIRDNKMSAVAAADALARKSTPQTKQTICVSKNASNSSIDSVESSRFDANVSSSLEASTCSNDLIYGSQELPVLKISSNEGTLTNSPVSPCSKEIAFSHDTLSPPKTLEPHDRKQERVRKTSWISRGGDAVPATLDRLLSIFHHPSNLFFTRSTNADVGRKESPQSSPQNDSKPPSRKESPMGGLFAWTKKDSSPEDRSPIAEPAANNNNSINAAKATKSPLLANISPDAPLNAETIAIDVIPMQLKQDVKENTSPEHTVTADSMANLQTNLIRTQNFCNRETIGDSNFAHADQKYHQIAVHEPADDKLDQNNDAIAVEVTQSQKANLVEQVVVTATTPSPPVVVMVEEDKESTDETMPAWSRVEKVHFEVGGDDDDDDDDDGNDYEDGDNAKNKQSFTTITSSPTVTGTTTTTSTKQTSKTTLSDTQSQLSPSTTANNLLPKKALGLGQIARDSLSILKGENNSQDSMRSLESLSELVFEDGHCINTHQPTIVPEMKHE